MISSNDRRLFVPESISITFDQESRRWELQVDNGDGSLERLGFVSAPASEGRNEIEDALNNTQLVLFFFRHRARSLMPGELIPEKHHHLHDWNLQDSIERGHLTP